MNRRVKIKICGITNKADAMRLVDFNVDAVGFIITELDTSKKIGLDLASQIIEKLPSSVLSVVGVGKYQVEKIIEICRKSRADVVQLQKGGSLEDIRRIRGALPKMKIWRTVFTNREMKMDEVLELEKAVDAILIHSKEDQWESGLKIKKRLKRPFVLAGGLDAGNIERAIKMFNPWMVDLIGGVETTLGKKDFGKVERFLEIVRG